MRKIFTFLFAALMSAASMWAQTETLLTTITATGDKQASYSTANVATVSFSYTSGGASAYLANWGWWGYGWIATVNAAEGYTITKCVFYDDANRTATDSQAPFVVETTEEDKTPKVNGKPIEEDMSKGIKKIEVYGYVTPTNYTLKLVADPTMGSVAVTNLLGSDIVDNGNGTYTVPENAKVTILATPNEGYAFTGWLEGNVLCDFIDCGVALNTLDNPLTFTMTNDAACKAEFAAVAPAGEVTVVFAANDKTAERTVTLPHTFWCDLGTENGELDLIIQELFALPLGGYCDAWNGPVATGNPAVTAGAGDEDDDFITISEAFEGTATVSGKYNKYTEMDEEDFNYSLTISIKAGSATAVENVQTNHVQATKFFRDGQLLIEKNGKIYNVNGAEVK